MTKFLQEMAKKHLVVEWFAWLPCKHDFINSTILETYEDIPYTIPLLKLLEQRVHELVGGPQYNTIDHFALKKRLLQNRI